MSYIVADTLEDIEEFLAEQDAAIIAEVLAVAPDVIAYKEGVPVGIKGRNAATGELEHRRGFTTSFAAPVELEDGRFAVFEAGAGEGDESELGGGKQKLKIKRKNLRVPLKAKWKRLETVKIKSKQLEE